MRRCRGIARNRRLWAIAGLVAPLATLTLAATARADVPTAVTATAYNGNLEVFYTGRDAGLWQLSYAPVGGWGIAREVPGSAGAVTDGGLSAVVVPAADPDLDVFYRNTAGHLAARVTGTAMGWQTPVFDLGGTPTSSPGGDVWRNGGEVDMFYKGSANDLRALWRRPTTGWEPEDVIGTPAGLSLTSAPTADVFANGTSVDVYARVTGNTLYGLYWTDSNGWSGWTENPGTDGELTSAPSAVVSPNGSQVHVIYAGTNGGLWDTWFASGTGWTAPAPIPGTAGTVVSAPAAVEYDGRIDVFYLSSDNSDLREVSSGDGVTWTGPAVPAPTPAAAPPPTSAPAPAPAPATVATTPPAATPVPAGPAAIKARFGFKWRFHGRRTRLMKLSVRHMPTQAYVHFACAGKHCPKLRGAGSTRLKRFERRLDGHVFRAGDILQLGVSKKGFRTERVRVKIRKGRAPRVWLVRKASKLSAVAHHHHVGKLKGD